MSTFGLHKRGKFYWTEFRVRGTRVYKSTKCTDPDDAEQVAAKWYNDLAKEAQGVWVDHGYTVRDLWDIWWRDTVPPILSEGHRAGVERNWRLHILPTFGHRAADSITVEDAENLRRTYLSSPSLRYSHQAEQRLANLRKRTKNPEAQLPKPKPRTIRSSNQLLLHFHLVFAYAVEVYKALREVPWNVRILDYQSAPKPSLETDQITPFLAEIDRTGNLQVQVGVRAMLYLSLREDEILSMRWEWFGSGLRTFQHGNRKAKDTPRFAVPADLIRLLQLLSPLPSGLVLPAKDGDTHWGQFTTKALARAGKALGIHLTPHSMRHSWATMTARKTGNALLIQKGLGHKTLKMSSEYVATATKDLDQAGAAVFGDLWTGEKPKSHHQIGKYRVKIKNKEVK